MQKIQTTIIPIELEVRVANFRELKVMYVCPYNPVSLSMPEYYIHDHGYASE